MANSSSEENLKDSGSRFPLKVDKCPVCGCTETIEALAIREEIEAGRLPEEARPVYSPFMALLVAPGMTKILGVPVRGYVKFLAGCSKCGAAYFIESKTKQFPMDDKGNPVMDPR